MSKINVTMNGVPMAKPPSFAPGIQGTSGGTEVMKLSPLDLTYANLMGTPVTFVLTLDTAPGNFRCPSFAVSCSLHHACPGQASFGSSPGRFRTL